MILECLSGIILLVFDSGCFFFDVCFEVEFVDVFFFEWLFGDNNISIIFNLCYIFIELGMYMVSFRVVNELGCYSIYDFVNV